MPIDAWIYNLCECNVSHSSVVRGIFSSMVICPLKFCRFYADYEYRPFFSIWNFIVSLLENVSVEELQNLN